MRPFSIRPAIRHLAVIGNALPRQCGLATYTTHSVQALHKSFPGLVIDHYALDDGHGVTYGADVHRTIPEDDVSAYVRAGAEIERSDAEAIWIQHEFGIFGGSAGKHLLTLLQHSKKPVLITLHTVLAEPDSDQAEVMRALVARADHFIVMAQHAAALLQSVYGVTADCITIIPHGAPDRALRSPAEVKQQLGLGDSPLVLTFGLLSPGKGIEYAIRALPTVLRQHPDLRYMIIGATHPALRREQGEAYRESLIALAEELGVAEHVQLVNRFLDNDELLDHLQACDVYLTPYLGRGQVTSGTLAYALAMGRPVVSTPYIHATEALAGGIGTLVPFRDSDAIASALLNLFGDRKRLASHTAAIWEAARHTVWSHNAKGVMRTLVDMVDHAPVRLVDHRPADRISDVDLSGVASMTDGVGIFQHSLFGVPDRHHGYCIDDNARALMLVCQTRHGDPAQRRRLASTYAAFVQHAWSPDRGKFRNFMGYDRQWLEDEGSDDSNGRTIWALGCVVRDSEDNLLRRWATALFNDALPLVGQLQSPRAIAFSMLGMAAMMEVEPGHERCRTLLEDGCMLFGALLNRSKRPDWPWFEAVLAYDNARLPQALIEAGRAIGDPVAVRAGLTTLDWIATLQTAPEGHFRPVGSESFGRSYAQPMMFDQQPLEAAATVDACAAAWRVTSNPRWLVHARAAVAWFGGANDLGLPLGDPETGRCFDGLTPNGANLNQGAESIVSLQLALATACMLPPIEVAREISGVAAVA